MANHGNFAFGGSQRSYSFNNFHADAIPTDTSAAQCPNMPCEQVYLQNDPSSTGNIIIGDRDTLPAKGTGFVLQPGDVTGWIPVNNLNLIWHKDADATTILNYMMFW